VGQIRFLAANRARLALVDWAAIDGGTGASVWRALCDAWKQHAVAFAEVEHADCTRMPPALHDADAATRVRAVLCAYNRSVRLTDRSPDRDRLHALTVAQPLGFGASTLLPPPSPCDQVCFFVISLSH
jgi:hypothetical protein